ncbi:hypothetical protein EVG20_g549 [Dentipellis fragilis]|uniref:RING-type E3 ubiquitin transferase n=1 Tax=Dentipellis fragilis TaxID=205917 RepID=A0A4Y9ZCZ0_9AGAM|nr:hypothetical protein EVG20_g549 [Dentipellis fragilis]
MDQDIGEGRELSASDSGQDPNDTTLGELTVVDGEVDTCRICSAPAEPDQPLFYPCKCSGTIRYIHQDCLTTWLAHSKKKTCDVCKHPYAFTKVYAEDMPRRLPVFLLVRRLVQQTFFALLFLLRAVLVAVVWLAVLPWITVWTWRMYFVMGNATAWWISARERPASSASPFFFYNLTVARNASSNATDVAVTMPTTADNGTLVDAEPQSFVKLALGHPLLRTISADIFTGQIIATLIVLVFIAIFLLREWISQNAHPGLLEGAEIHEGQLVVDHEPDEQVQAGRQPRQAAEEEGDEEGELQAERRPLQGGLPYPERPMKDLPARRAREEHTEHALGSSPSASPSASTGVSTDSGSAGPSGVPPVESASSSWQNVSLGTETEAGEKGKGKATDLFDFSVDFTNISWPDQPSSLKRTVPLPPSPELPNTSAPLDELAAKAQESIQRLSDSWDFADREWGKQPSSPNRRRRSVLQRPSASEKGKGKGFEDASAEKRARRRVSEEFMLNEPEIHAQIADFTGLKGRPGIHYAATLNREDNALRRARLTKSLHQIKEELQAEGKWRPPPFAQAAEASQPPAPPATTQATDKPKPSFSFAKDDVNVEQLFGANQRHPCPPPIPTSTPGRPSRIPVPRRPPMPSATLPTPTTPPAALRSKEHTPLASPSLATYRAPEEFQEGSSRQSYFDPVQEEDDEQTYEEDHAHFFRLPEEGPNGVDGARRVGVRDLLGGGETGEFAGPETETEDEEMQEGILEMEELEDHDVEEQNDADVPEEEVQLVEGGEQQPADGEVALAAAELDDADLNVEDDMEGALEAIGLRGPIFAIAQNAALMIFVLDTAIGLGIWFPFTLGKSFALLSLDPRGALQILHWPIRCMRYITDPFVDAFVAMFTRLLIPGLTQIGKTIFRLVVRNGAHFFQPLLGHETVAKIQQTVETIRDDGLGKISSFLHPSEIPLPDADTSVQTFASRIFDSDIAMLRSSEAYFAALGKKVRVSSLNLQQGWIRLALGDGSTEKVFAVALGYAVFGLLLAFYLNVLTVGTVKNAGRAVRSAVRQQLLVLKVGAFIIIELVIFPLGCGLNLDLCSLWMFPDITIWSRIAFFKHAPLTATFYHWVAGTMFMYQFAILLAGCRSIMRPGAMWFVKDPSDQNFHPIRDILDRPALTQLRKLSMSALMYGLVVAGGVSSVGGLMWLCSTVLPFRWRPREPLSNVPIDLLFLHVVLPYTMRFFRPRKALRLLSISVWKYICGYLRLTSYMFGDRHPNEETSDRQWTWLPSRKAGTDVAHDDAAFDGSYRRVPATDNVVLPRDMRATAEVDVNGEPVDDVARNLMKLQNAEADRVKRNWKEDYTVVYIPPNFRYRLMALIFALWMLGTVFIAISIAAPIHFGRQFFALFTKKEVHDGYSFFVGFYTLWACFAFGHTINRMERRRNRRGAEEPRADWPLFLLKRSVLWTAKVSYMFVFLGVIIPILVALVMELYVVLPLRFLITPSMTPRIRIVDMWALGIIYIKVALRVHRRPRGRFMAGIVHIRQRGWTSPDPIAATAEVIGPVILGLTAMLLLPPVLFYQLQQYFKLQLDSKFIFMHVYPGIFAVAGFGSSVMSSYSLLSSWSQSIRDKEFLVEMRLRNYEQEAREKKEADNRETAEGSEDGDGEEGDIEVVG